MSGYTSGNNAPTLMAQAPNRKGNISKKPPISNVGVTAQTRPQGSVAYAPGKMGVASHNGNPMNGKGQKVMVSRPKELYDGMCHNDGYMNSDRTNYLK
jgi:hypothetical protein